MSDLGSLLGRWHQWRRAYSVERGYTRQCLDNGPSFGDEDELEHLLMRSVEDEIAKMPGELQLALQHIARAECMGVEVIFSPRLGEKAHREKLVNRAIELLNKRLLQAGVF